MDIGSCTAKYARIIKLLGIPIVGTTEAHIYTLENFQEVLEHIFEKLSVHYIRIEGKIPYKIQYKKDLHEITFQEYVLSILNILKAELENIKTQVSSSSIQMLLFQKLLSNVTLNFDNDNKLFNIIKNDLYIFPFALIVEDSEIQQHPKHITGVDFESTLSVPNWYFERSALFCKFMTQPQRILIEYYTQGSELVTVNNIIAFITNNVKHLETIYRDGLDVAHYNYLIIDMFLSWFTHNTNVTTNLEADPIIYSGGVLLCDRLGIPISSKLNDSVYLMTCLSATANIKMAHSFLRNCMYEITVPKHLVNYLMPVEECTAMFDGGECEIILPIGSSFKITNVIKSTKAYNNRTMYVISMTLEDYDIDSLNNLKYLFGLASKTKKLIQKGGKTNVKLTESCKDISCGGFFTKNDIDSLKTIMDVSKIPTENKFNKVQDIGNYLCSRLKTTCDKKEYKNTIQKMVKCVTENCIILPYLRYNLDIPKYIDSDIGYINVGDIKGLEDGNLAYTTFGKKIMERYNYKEADLVILDQKMVMFFNNDNIFKMNKYVHWKLYNLYHSTDNEFTKSVIKTVKQNIRYKQSK